ncbi:acyl--CoA ligase [Alkalihalobacillus sp. MEB130]|uniref:class I adenylate-forming enzyme family protein n=1 Tax=Alkalihalobacillus sp. MEB130 TaxID=2976704 RepID=UPI0028DEB812|nr:class I adenylate-forming enzyme family protein [Alkalihalobacillus sp. MEB130]MDT8861333.1 acyl--CoA ligase [Alkalihalobacillus sp. MEB130]
MIVKDNSISVSQLLTQAVEANPNREALYDLNERITYKQLDDQVKQLVYCLANLGVQKGDRIGVCLPNWNETPVIFFAVAKLGAIVVPFNPGYREHEITYIINNAKPKFLFLCEKVTEMVKLPSLQSMVDKIISVRFESEHTISYDSLFHSEEKEEIKLPVIDANNDIFCILYTSGTTGIPKGVMLPHRSIVQSGIAIATSLQCTSEDVFIVPAPLFHIFGIACNLMAAFSCQARLVLQERFKPEHTLELIESEKVTIHQGVPTMFVMELNHPNFANYNLSTLRTGMVGAAPCPPETVKAVREKMGLNLLISFGISETGTVTITDYHEDEANFETVGKPIDGVEVKIVNENREPLPIGEIGEIACKSFGTMKGYYKMKEQTEQVLDDDGWYYTGDLGMLNRDGYLRFVGRKKEMIIRGGYNIYPQEIEGLLVKHPKVMECAVVGVPNEVLGELVYAIVKVKSGQQCSSDEIKSFLKEQIASYKVPSEVVFVKDFPVTASGKIQKGKLKDIVSQQQEKK